MDQVGTRYTGSCLISSCWAVNKPNVTDITSGQAALIPGNELDGRYWLKDLAKAPTCIIYLVYFNGQYSVLQGEPD